MNTRIVRFWVATGVLVSAATASAGADAMPRYALKPGQVLTYEENQTFKARSYNSTYTKAWKLWVVGRNDDESVWRVVGRQAMKTHREQGSSPSEHETVSFARFDLHPDGRVPFSPTLGTRINPAEIFPRLPADASEAADWQARDDRDDATIHYKPLVGRDRQDGATFDFVADQRTFMERCYEGKDSRTFHFDRTKGLVARVEMTRAYGSHLQGEGKGTLELKSVEQRQPVELAAFGVEMDRFFAAQQGYDALYDSAKTSGDRAETVLKEARTLLAAARAKLTLPEPIAALDDALKNHDAYAINQAEAAKRFAAILDHPSPAWELKDLDGRTHALEMYRGQVLVLDFWYRGCGWCMRAMPQVKEIARHYRDKPVAVFGMNNDRNEDDAKFVVREMQLNYPVLRSKELPMYGVNAFPTLIIIDRQGKVADIHVGYCPQLFEEVTAAVDRLLEAK